MSEDFNTVRRALIHTKLFIHNGIELGYIMLPGEGSNDPALALPANIDKALAALDRLAAFVSLETGFDVTDPKLNAARYDGYLDGVSVGLAAAKTVDVEELKKESREHFNAFSREYRSIMHAHGDDVIDYLISKGLLNGSNTAGKDGE